MCGYSTDMLQKAAFEYEIRNILQPHKNDVDWAPQLIDYMARRIKQIDTMYPPEERN